MVTNGQAAPDVSWVDAYVATRATEAAQEDLKAATVALLEAARTPEEQKRVCDALVADLRAKYDHQLGLAMPTFWASFVPGGRAAVRWLADTDRRQWGLEAALTAAEAAFDHLQAKLGTSSEDATEAQLSKLIHGVTASRNIRARMDDMQRRDLYVRAFDVRTPKSHRSVWGAW